MAVTRDPDYPPKLAQLFQAISACADGYEIEEVLDVAANFLVCAINMAATARPENPIDVASAICASVQEGVALNCNREPAANDVLVKGIPDRQ